ncbi:MAG: response regulator [Phaeodactylibacter sp.]|uniref:LytR/AlgR family response regulator transcription factor n=1 Tax=Phaeodactylibacter sp. TaxID=1940289 RepID=UPI0032F041D0
MPNPQILIVEDDPIIAADLEDRLQEMGYGILANVPSGEAALRAVEAQQPALVLMDIQLEGELDGVDTAKRMAERYSFPIIFLTSNSDRVTFDRAKDSRPQAFLSKPFRGRDLRHSIALALSQADSDTQGLSSVSGRTDQLDDRIFIKSKDLMVKILLRDILWVEADDYYCKIVTVDAKHLATLTLKKFSEQVQADFLMRVHRSFMVNLNQIDKVGGLYVYIKDHKIPVGKSYSKTLQQRLKLL